MTTETRSFTFAPNDTRFGGQGRIWYIKSAPTGPLTITCRKSGSGSTNVRAFTNMPAGAKFKAELGDGWDILEITSATAQIVEMILGDDDVEIAQAVSVTGNAATIEQPCASFSNIPPVVTAPGQGVLFASNLTRRRITVTAHPNNVNTVYFRPSGFANIIGQVQPGMTFTFANTGAIDYYEAGPGGETLYLMQEQ